MSDHRHTITAAAVNQRNCFVNSALIGGLGDYCMGGAHLRAKAADYWRLARGLSSHSPTRAHLIVMAEWLERQAKEFDKEIDKEIDKEFEHGAAPAQQDEAGNSESDNPEL